ncbi:hypothetical protein D4S03_01780 [bacterium]|nr:MAG: hypothetical protein D4S03_01780 [bacterium]
MEVALVKNDKLIRVRLLEEGKMKKVLLTIACTSLLLIVTLGILLYNGYIWFNNPSFSDFPVRGIDISSHQGEISWEKLKGQNFSFAFIKATEGKDYKDKYFKENWVNAKRIGLKVGAYHFYTFGSTGLEQANNYISTVPKNISNLSPVIDVEFGGNSKNIPDKVALKKELKIFIEQITSEYEQKPIIYVTYEAYSKYIQGDFNECQIWIRDIFGYPSLQDKREWILWQYNNRGRVDGINGFVDLNVFKGSREDFEKFILNDK